MFHPSFTNNSFIDKIQNISIYPLSNIFSFKPIAPNPATLAAAVGASSDNAMLLLKFPGGDTIKLSNLPFVKCDTSAAAAMTPPVTQETRLRLQKVLGSSTARPNLSSTSTSTSSSSSALSSTPPAESPATADTDTSKDELKERNRMSAQRSRTKKRQQLETVMETCDKTLRENEELRAENKLLAEENARLRRLLGAQLDPRPQLQLSSATAGTQTVATRHGGEQAPFRYPAPAPATSPPQTHPEDLRVGRHTPPPPPPPVLEVAASVAPSSSGRGRSRVKQTLALHCHKVETQRTLKQTNKGVVTRRLKDKLQILKQKLAEDENTLSDIKSGNLK